MDALQALQAAVGEQVPGGVLVGTEGGRPVYWDSPQATPDGVRPLNMPVDLNHGCTVLAIRQTAILSLGNHDVLPSQQSAWRCVTLGQTYLKACSNTFRFLCV